MSLHGPVPCCWFQSLDPAEDFNFTTGIHTEPRRFLECVEDNLLTQLVCEPAGDGVPLDLLLVSREGLVCDVKVRGHLRHSNHELKDFSILGRVRRGFSRTATLDFQRADFGLLRRRVGGVPQEAVLKGKGAQEGWMLLRREILKAQEQAVPTC